MSEDMDLGAIGYDAYAQSTGGLTFDGRRMPKWHALPVNVKEAWRAAGVAIVKETVAMGIRAGHEAFKTLLNEHAEQLAAAGDKSAIHFAALADAERGLVVDDADAHAALAATLQGPWDANGTPVTDAPPASEKRPTTDVEKTNAVE